MTVDWPTNLVAIQLDLHLEGGSTSSGFGLDGDEQIVGRENRRWTGVVDCNPVMHAKIPELLAFSDKLKGRRETFRFYVCNTYAPKYGTDDLTFYRQFGYTDTEIAQGFTTFSDGATFDDGSGFALPPNAASTVSVPASAGESSISASGIANLLPAGTYFSINDFLYRVCEVSNGLVHFNPPLREDVASGAVMETNTPSIIVRATRPVRFPVEFHRRTQPVRIEFVEASARDVEITGVYVDGVYEAGVYA